MSPRKPAPAAQPEPTENETTSPAIEEVTPPTYADGVPAVFQAIHYVQGRFSSVGLAKNRQNEQQKYKFRGIDDVYNSLATYLVEAKLVILPRVLTRGVDERTTKQGGLLIYTCISAEYDFYSTVDGSKVTIGPFYGEAMDSADKSTNKAMSAAYKYLCLQTFCIPTEGDNDADATTHEPAPKQAPAQRQAPAPRQAPRQELPPQQRTEYETDESTTPPTRRPQRDTGPKATVTFHIQAIKAATNSQELRAAFGLAWKQYESQNGPQEITDAQQRFKDIYNARRDELIQASDETQLPLPVEGGQPPDERQEGEENIWPDGA